MRRIFTLLLLLQFTIQFTEAVLNITKHDILRWNEEIAASVQRNFAPTCRRIFAEKAIQLDRITNSEQFFIKRYYPRRTDVDVFSSLPATITKGHHRMMAEASLTGYDHKTYGQENYLKWMIPNNHPGQNRNNCLLMSQYATNGGPTYYAFYEEFKQVDRAFYTATINNAYIFPTGIVMASCGEYYGEESCENRFLDLTRSKINNCRAHLARYSIKWRQLFLSPRELIEANLSLISDELWQKWNDSCSIPLRSSLRAEVNPKSTERVPIYDKVFVLTALWDCTYHHFVVDSLARLAHHYEFLKHNDDIKIHVKAHEDFDDRVGNLVSSKIMRKQMFDLLGFNQSRFVSGPVFAKKVYIPRTMRCSYAISNPIEIRLIARYLLMNMRRYIHQKYPELEKYFVRGGLNQQHTSQQKTKKGGTIHHVLNKMGITIANKRRSLQAVPFPTDQSSTNHSSSRNTTRGEFVQSLPSFLSILSNEFKERSSFRWPEGLDPGLISEQVEKFSNNKMKSKYIAIMQRHPGKRSPGIREWDDPQFARVIMSVAQAFPEHSIIPLSSLAQSRHDYCLACDVFLYSQAEILIGMHGSGFTNAMFLPPHGLMLEIVEEFNDLHMPICGYHGVYAGIFGLHHYIYVYNRRRGPQLDTHLPEITYDSRKFYQFLQRYRQKKLVGNETVVILSNTTGSEIAPSCRP